MRFATAVVAGGTDWMTQLPLSSTNPNPTNTTTSEPH
jgi:hypothetical protein